MRITLTAPTPETLPPALLDALRAGRGLLAERRRLEAERQAERVRRERQAEEESWAALCAAARADLEPLALWSYALLDPRRFGPGQREYWAPCVLPGLGVVWACYLRSFDGWERRSFLLESSPARLWGASLSHLPGSLRGENLSGDLGEALAMVEALQAGTAMPPE